MMDVWVILWIIICITIIISVLESISRRAKERRRLLEEEEMQQRINLQQFQVYTLQSYGSSVSPRSSSTPSLFNSTILSIQQQQQLHHLQELKAYQDLPPKYEDVVLTAPSNENTARTGSSNTNSTTGTTTVERY